MIVIVDTGVFNRYSIRNALEHLGATVKVSADAQDILDADKLVFPGVGAFAAGMESVRSRGLVEPLHRAVREQGKFVLGICLGYQLMADVSEEDGTHAGLGWIPGRIRRLDPESMDNGERIRVPHVGFNDVTATRAGRLFNGLPPSSDFYFVHSYFLETSPDFVAATVDYGQKFCVAVEHENIMGTQFHCEKSQSAGLAVLRNFLDAH